MSILMLLVNMTLRGTWRSSNGRKTYMRGSNAKSLLKFRLDRTGEVSTDRLRNAEAMRALSREPVVWERPAVTETHKRVAEHHPVLPVVVAERKLVKVAIKVLG